MGLIFNQESFGLNKAPKCTIPKKQQLRLKRPIFKMPHRELRAIQTKSEKSEPQLAQYESLYPRNPKSPKFDRLKICDIPLLCSTLLLPLHSILS